MFKPSRIIIISALLAGGALCSVLVSAIAMQVGYGELAVYSSRLALLFALGMVLYILPRLAQSVRLEALRSEISFRLSTGGWIFLALLLLVSLLALGTGNNLLYLVVALLGATLLVSEVASRLSLSRIDVQLRFPDHIFAREPARFEVAVDNHKRLLPSFSLTVAAARREGASEPDAPLDRLAFFPIVPAGAIARTSFEIEMPRRGVYPVRGFRISTRFPFGFIERRRYAAASGEILVYPMRQPLDETLRRLPLTEGQTESPVRGSGSDLYSIRQYLSTDHPRHIDWKATAKTARLMVREFTRDDDWQVTIVFDPTRPAALTPEETEAFNQLFERGVTMAANLISHLIGEGAEVRLIIGPYGYDDLGYGSSQAHCYRMLAHLARIEPVPGDNRAPEEYLEEVAPLFADEQFKILLTPAKRTQIPPRALRATQVICFEELTDRSESSAPAVDPLPASTTLPA